MTSSTLFVADSSYRSLCAGLVVVLTYRTRHPRNIDWDYLAVRLARHPQGMQPNLWVICHHYRGIIGTQDHRHSRVTEVWRLACITSNTSAVSFKRIPFPETIWIPNTTRLLLCMNNSVGQLKLRSRMCQSLWSLMSQAMWLEACEVAWLQMDTVKTSIPRVINFKFPLQPHKKYYIPQYGEWGLS